MEVVMETVGWTPRSAADALAGFPSSDEAGFVCDGRVRGTRADRGVRPTLSALPWEENSPLRVQ
jgi:hypothetical protein